MTDGAWQVVRGDALVVSSLIYKAAGVSPEGNQQGACAICGQTTSLGKSLRLPATFLDWDKLAYPYSDLICPACDFCMTERSEILMQRTGKDKPQCMRNYSHFVLDGIWYPLSKAQKRQQYELLLQSPAVAVVAISGQKHLILRAQRDRWQIEENSIAPDPQRLKELCECMMILYLGKFSKSEIKTGVYMPYRIMRFGADAWYEHESRIRDWRGSAIFELALFLCQKEKKDGTKRIDRAMCQLGLDALARN